MERAHPQGKRKDKKGCLRVAHKGSARRASASRPGLHQEAADRRALERVAVKASRSDN